MKPWLCTPVVTVSDAHDSCPYAPPLSSACWGM